MERAFMEMLDMREQDGRMSLSLLLYLAVVAGGRCGMTESGRREGDVDGRSRERAQESKQSRGKAKSDWDCRLSLQRLP